MFPLLLVFGPGIFWSGLNFNRSGWDVQPLQMRSEGVRPFSLLVVNFDGYCDLRLL